MIDRTNDNTCTDDKCFCRGDFAGCGDLTREEPSKVVGGFKNALIASNVGHGAKDIEGLSTTGAGNAVKGENVGLLFLEKLDQRLILFRI